MGDGQVKCFFYGLDDIECPCSGGAPIVSENAASATQLLVWLGVGALVFVVLVLLAVVSGGRL